VEHRLNTWPNTLWGFLLNRTPSPYFLLVYTSIPSPIPFCDSDIKLKNTFSLVRICTVHCHPRGIGDTMCCNEPGAMASKGAEITAIYNNSRDLMSLYLYFISRLNRPGYPDGFLFFSIIFFGRFMNRPVHW